MTDENTQTKINNDIFDTISLNANEKNEAIDLEFSKNEKSFEFQKKTLTNVSLEEKDMSLEERLMSVVYPDYPKKTAKWVRSELSKQQIDEIFDENDKLFDPKYSWFNGHINEYKGENLYWHLEERMSPQRKNFETFWNMFLSDTLEKKKKIGNVEQIHCVLHHDKTPTSELDTLKRYFKSYFYMSMPTHFFKYLLNLIKTQKKYHSKEYLNHTFRYTKRFFKHFYQIKQIDIHPSKANLKNVIVLKIQFDVLLGKEREPIRKHDNIHIPMMHIVKRNNRHNFENEYDEMFDDVINVDDDNYLYDNFEDDNIVICNTKTSVGHHSPVQLQNAHSGNGNGSGGGDDNWTMV